MFAACGHAADTAHRCRDSAPRDGSAQGGKSGASPWWGETERILTDMAVRAEEIDKANAEAARKRAGRRSPRS
ncbi:MAG: hypothetical protein WC429_15580 [Verrucomicrobiia bacterium]|jgi:hypothetical protein